MLRLERFVLVIVVRGQLPEDVELFDSKEFDFAVLTVKFTSHHI